jgi:radical SAM protein with 4Fe4S-binding SPASM domain
MKNIFGNHNFQRILIAGAHGQFRDTLRKGVQLVSRRKNKYGLKFPYMITLEVTNDCTLNCIMCPRSQRTDGPGYMSLELFQKVVSECAAHKSMIELVFTGMGEPLLHPQILDMFKIAKNAGIPTVRVVTTALLLTKDKVDTILDSPGLDQISISLDALTPETYRKVKGRSCFNQVIENIEYFLGQRNRRKRWKPFVNLHILKIRETASEVKEFVQKWEQKLKKGDQIIVKGFHTFAGTVDELREKKFEYPGERFPCRQIWELGSISWDGDVMPCCVDALKEIKIGSLNESTLWELWNGPAIQKIRDIHLKGHYDRIPLCSKCEHWWFLTKGPT